MSKTVRDIYDNDLCSSCGICIGVCEFKAIKYKIDKFGFFKPVISKKKCEDCGKCFIICQNRLYKNYGEKNVESYSIAYSKNGDIRYNSSSGGLVTELLSFLLKKKIVERVSIIPNITNLKHIVKSKLTNDTKEVFEASGSKYLPISHDNIFMDLLKYKSIAFVGLPCQIKSFKKYLEVNKINGLTVIFIGLLCNHIPSYNASKFLLYNNKISVKELRKLKFRGKGWPGFFQLEDNCKTIQLPYRVTVAKGFGKYFKNSRCVYCEDSFASYADISIGDPYCLQQDEIDGGKSFIIVRNSIVLNILNEMRDEKIIHLNCNIDYEKIEKGFSYFFERDKSLQELCDTTNSDELNLYNLMSNSRKSFLCTNKNFCNRYIANLKNKINGTKKRKWKKLYDNQK